MAINLKSNYQKRLGLPGYSSHSFSAEIQVEINSADDIPTEISSRRGQAEKCII